MRAWRCAPLGLPNAAQPHQRPRLAAYVPASACRPMSVILSRVTVIGRLPAYMIPGAAVASPSRTRPTSSSAVKPCASMIASVQPCGDPASSLSARFSSAPRQTFRGLTAIVQAFARGLLLPVRPRVGANDPAPRAYHARPERRHRHVVRPGRRTDDRLVVAQVAADGQRVYAVRPHVAEGHRLDWYVEASGRHPFRLRRLPSLWQSTGLAPQGRADGFRTCLVGGPARARPPRNAPPRHAGGGGAAAFPSCEPHAVA
jgi:hypothetical protein